MPVRACCPECGTDYELADHLGGKRVLCAKCNRAFEVPAPGAETVAEPAAGADPKNQPDRVPPRREERAEEEPPPRRRRRDEEDDWPRRRRPDGTPVGLIVGAAVGGVVLLICAACGLGFFLSRARAPAPVAGGGDPPGVIVLPPVLSGPQTAEAHYNHAKALERQGRLREAEAAYRQAIRLRPNYPEAHNDLGLVLSVQDRSAEAEAEVREAIRLKPDFVPAHKNLGHVLVDQSRYKEGEAEIREALRLKPDDPEAHSSLANALYNQGRYKEADAAYRATEAAYRDFLRRNPETPLALCNLGFALENQGRFAETLESMRRGHALGAMSPDWHGRSGEWVAQLERLVELDRRLPALLRGDEEPVSSRERLGLASFCQRYRRLTRTAARLAEEAYHDDPKLAEQLNEDRYNAACGAVLAAAGQGEDAHLVPDRVSVMLRRQGLRWLRADLALYAGEVARADPDANRIVRRRMTHWLQDGDFTSVRGEAALARLPDQEREEWRKLWADVAAMRQRAELPR